MPKRSRDTVPLIKQTRRACLSLAGPARDYQQRGEGDPREEIS